MGFGSPQMHGRIGAPGPPLFGAREQLGGGRPFTDPVAQGARDADITHREGVRFAQLAHGDILRRPFANSRQCSQ